MVVLCFVRMVILCLPSRGQGDGWIRSAQALPGLVSGRTTGAEAPLCTYCSVLLVLMLTLEAGLGFVLLCPCDCPQMQIVGQTSVGAVLP